MTDVASTSENSLSEGSEKPTVSKTVVDPNPNWLSEYWFEIALGLAGAFVLVLGLGGVLLGAHLGPAEGRALIGDFVGGMTTPILTALTFIGVLFGIALQRRELIETRNELELTRQETANSANALKDQAAAIRVQNFERTLFESLSFLNSISEGLRISQGARARTLEGRECFANLYSRLRNNLRHADYKDESLTTLRDDDLLADQLSSTSPQLAAYFRTLYNIYRYIDDSEFREKKFYSRIVRAQLDNFLSLILFYNSISEIGWKFQKYIRKYGVLDNIPVTHIAHTSHIALLEEMTGREFVEAPKENPNN